MPSLHWKKNKKKINMTETQGTKAGKTKALISTKGTLILAVKNRTLKSGGSNTKSHIARAVPKSHDMIHIRA